VDAQDERAVEAHIGGVVEQTMGIDVLFNAIGMEDIQGTALLDMPVGDFLHPVVVGMRTQFLTARAVARHMVQRGSGVILSITAEPTPVPHVGGFGAACAAIEGLWRTLAAELGPSGVRLVILRSAGSPDTPDVQEVFKIHARASGVSVDEYTAYTGRGAMLRRLPKVAEVAAAATILASDYASAMTATMANVTCGAYFDV
jgi:3-oxoacyl-[acyl-carrier protein] reductase